MGAQSAQTSPPSGTGHVPGFGESFNINLNTGQGVYSYKIALPEGIAKHTPSITLEYSSSHQYGNYGWGWDIGIRKISRKLDSGSDVLKEIYLANRQEILKIKECVKENNKKAENFVYQYTKECQDKMQKWLKTQNVKHTVSKNLDAAVDQAHTMAQERGRGVVLLSPVYKSFDQFKSFEHRGKEFVKLVGAL